MVVAVAVNPPEPPEPVDRIGLLILRVAAGDRAAFEELFRLMLRASCGRARGILGASGLVDDAVHEAALRVWTNAATFRPGNGRAWYLKVVQNTALSIARSHGRTEVISPAHAVDTADRRQRVIDADGIHVSAVELNFLERIRRAPWFLSLRPRDQRIIVLRYLGFTNVEIMDQLPDVSHNETIRRAMERAAKKLGDEHPGAL